ncbi:MAG TPA: D-2-hydroxyacid dehydrogenase family protein [Steroidobacteraceae bacterium]|nr:D-2-hydroxyacid dehydrogenase family protein [Steroidobacteraceae bacterium]
MSHRIALLDDYLGIALKTADWSRLPDCEVVAFTRPLSGDELVAALQPFDIVMALRERSQFPARLLERLPRLKLLVTAGMRNAAIDITAARALGMTVCGTGGLSYPTAELAIAMILDLARDIPAQQASLRAGRWQTSAGIGLNGKVLGLIGLGTLGSRVARIAQALEMQVIAWSHHLTAERAREHGARRCDKDELLAAADFVSIHLVLGERTRGLIGARELGLMKRSAYLVNTSRSAIVDQSALIEALEAGRIAGAGLDVYDQEPLPVDHPILRAPRTLLTPHIGYATAETFAVFYRDALEDIEAYLAGRPMRVL